MQTQLSWQTLNNINAHASATKAKEMQEKRDEERKTAPSGKQTSANEEIQLD